MDKIGEQNSQSYLIFKITYKISLGMNFCKKTWHNSDSQQNTSGAYY